MLVKGKKIKKRIASYLLVLAMLFSLVSINEIDAKAAVTLSGSQIAEYCNKKVGSTYPAGYCLAWVASIFRELGAGTSSACCAYNYGRQHLQSTSSDNIPVGADVYFSGSTTRCSNCGNTCGHVAIYVGDGYIVHSYSGKIHKDRLSTVMGWSNNRNMGWGYHGNVTISGGSPVVKGEQTISDGRYHIVSNLNENMGLDVAGASKADGANINLYTNTADNTQTFDITYLGNGYYKMVNSYSGKAVDVAGASPISGTNVHSYQQNGTNAQQWIIKETGDGYTYYIISACGYKYLDVAGASTANGTNVQIYDGNGTNAQRWKFIAVGNNIGKTVKDGEYHIVSALDNNKGIDVNGASTANFTNIQLYANVTDSTQTFNVKYLGDGYYSIIGKHSGKSIDVDGCRTYKMTNVQLCEWNNTNAQKWIIKKTGDYYSIITKSSGMYLDVNAGDSSNFTNIQVYTGNGTNAQKWKFVPVVKEVKKAEEKKAEQVVDKPEQEENKEPAVIEPKVEETKESVVIEPKVEETKESEVIEPKVEETKESEVIEPKVEETKESVVIEPKVEETKESVVIEPKEEVTTEPEVNKSEPRDATESLITEPKQEEVAEPSVNEKNKNVSSVVVEPKQEDRADDIVSWEDNNDYEIDAPVIKKLTNSKKRSIKIGISSGYGADGYEYAVAKVTNKTLRKFKKAVISAEEDGVSFNGIKTYSSKSTTVKLSGLKKNKRYAVTVRAYKVIDGERHYSDYSSVKCIKIRK